MLTVNVSEKEVRLFKQAYAALMEYPEFNDVSLSSFNVIKTGAKLLHPETGEPCHGLTLPNGTILIAGKMPLKETVSTFVHELVHHAQFYQHRLCDEWFIDPIENRLTANPYDSENSPHEREAELMEKLIMREHWPEWSKQ